ncbi:MAG: glycosyltransferase [Verrucomicrobiales bacterium]|nr:glycosyltransferase [Verrucomicrobiales bacterium]
MQPTLSHSHLVLIPSYNTGDIVLKTVKRALEYWAPVWVVVDGSDDGSGEKLDALAKEEKNLRVFRLARNQGKGAALLHGFDEAEAHGYTHILCMDADGQHPEDMIPEYMSLSMAMPERMILGKPIFDDSAPRIRVNGRKLSNFWVHIETLGYGIGDSLFGMRVYPVGDLVRIMEKISGARRYDFDAEIAVRLSWRGVRPLNLPTPVKYLTADEGGVSHFKYLRDNILIAWMHTRLMFFSWWLKIPMLLLRKRRVRREDQLENPDSAESLKLIRTKLSKYYRRRWRQSYTKKKLQTDPVYDAVFDILQEAPELPLLDIGCGMGLLEFYLRERGIDCPIVAIDPDLEKIKLAHHIACEHYQHLRFEMGHAESLSLDFQGNVCLLDILQYFDEKNQRKVLRKAAQFVAPGAYLIIRSGLKDSSYRSRISSLIDRLAHWITWIDFSVHELPKQDLITETLAAEGLQGESRPLWGNTPFNNYLLSYRRPQSKDSAGGKTQR